MHVEDHYARDTNCTYICSLCGEWSISYHYNARANYNHTDSSHVSISYLKDLSRTVGREVAKMECNFAPSVYGFRPKTGSLGGAFGSTASPMRDVRVDIPFTPNKGLF